MNENFARIQGSSILTDFVDHIQSWRKFEIIFEKKCSKLLVFLTPFLHWTQYVFVQKRLIWVESFVIENLIR